MQDWVETLVSGIGIILPIMLFLNQNILSGNKNSIDEYVVYCIGAITVTFKKQISYFILTCSQKQAEYILLYPIIWLSVFAIITTLLTIFSRINVT
jgi:hypothetical protein